MGGSGKPPCSLKQPVPAQWIAGPPSDEFKIILKRTANLESLDDGGRLRAPDDGTPGKERREDPRLGRVHVHALDAVGPYEKVAVRKKKNTNN